MASGEVRTALKKNFPAKLVKQRQGPGGTKFDYVSGDTVIARLIEATAGAPSGYALNGDIKHIEYADGKWSVAVQVALMIDGDAGYGVGAMSNSDLDMAVKSATTEAIKNAAKNGYGVGLELYDADYRATLSQQRRLSSGSEQALKAEVWSIAKLKLGDAATPKEIAEHFGVKPGDLADPATLKSILEGEGYEFDA